MQLIADRLGCPKPRLYRDALGLTEGDCTIDGAEVTITDWATTPTGDVRDYLTSTGDLGYHNLLLPDGWSVGSDDAAFIRDAHDQLGGDIIN